MRFLRSVAVAAALSFAAVGCCSPEGGPAHREADIRLFKAIWPEYRAYLLADPALTAEEKERRMRTGRLWAELVGETP